MEAQQMRSTTSASVLKILRDWFSRFGFPCTVHADNGPQFSSAEFRTALASWGVKLSLSPPYHPQSNGTAERAVRTIKAALQKLGDVRDLETLLFWHRMAPLECGLSPAELLMGRKLRRCEFDCLRPGPDHGSRTMESPLAAPGTRIWYKIFSKNKNIVWGKGEVIKSIGAEY